MVKKSDVTLKNDPELWLTLLPKLDRNSNKYTRGHTTILGGYPLTGASRLSAYAAARIGSGLTTLLVPDIAFAIYASALTSMMVKPFNDMDKFDQLIKDPRISSFLIGPGAGVCDETRTQILKLLATSKPIVLDADALTVFQGELQSLKDHLRPNCVLTPHEGEFIRLFTLTENRILSVQQAAKACGAVVVLKGNETIIAAPDGRTFTSQNAPPFLATAGSGDVLAGMVAGLLAQGMPALYAAAAAVWVHGEAAKLFGAGLLAEDLPPLIPKVLKKLQQ